MRLCPQAWPIAGEGVVLGADHDRQRARSGAGLDGGGHVVGAALDGRSRRRRAASATSCAARTSSKHSSGWSWMASAEPDQRRPESRRRRACALRPSPR